MIQNKKIKVGIIGGSGVENPKILQNSMEKAMETPFGMPSEKLIIGKIGGQDVVVLSRHGKKHSIPPTHVPFRANMWALKELGCTHILATSACGSLKEEIKPRDFIFIDQYLDFTKSRPRTLYENFTEKIVHASMADPFCQSLRKILIETAGELKIKHHKKGAIVTIEGPCFSTRAESNMFRSFDADVVGMSTATEAILARESGLCYGVIGMVTDYDVWREDTEPVTWQMIFETMGHNAENAKKMILQVVPKIKSTDCECCQ